MRGIVAIFAVVLAACTALGPEIANSWVGRHVDELVTSWGPPQSSHQFADGRSVIAYGHQHAATVSAMNPYAPYQTNTFVYSCAATFDIDGGGIIAKANVRGNIGGCNQLLGDKRAFMHSSAPSAKRAP